MNQVSKFMYYIFNRWCIDEAIHVFGEDLGKHLFSKWCVMENDLMWYSQLDGTNREKIVARACECYPD